MRLNRAAMTHAAVAVLTWQNVSFAQSPPDSPYVQTILNLDCSALTPDTVGNPSRLGLPRSEIGTPEIRAIVKKAEQCHPEQIGKRGSASLAYMASQGLRSLSVMQVDKDRFALAQQKVEEDKKTQAQAELKAQ